MSVNLNLVASTPSDGQLWGYEYPVGSKNYTGLLGDLMENVADIGWANLFIVGSRLELMDFSIWHTMDPVCRVDAQPFTGETNTRFCNLGLCPDTCAKVIAQDLVLNPSHGFLHMAGHIRNDVISTCFLHHIPLLSQKDA